jgi:hypothetical protein
MAPESVMDYERAPKYGFGLYHDPLYGYIPTSETIRRALDLPSMQRLRYVKQLSSLYLVYPRRPNNSNG